MNRLIIASCVSLLVLCDVCLCDKCGSASDTPSRRLRRQLMCGYDQNQRPVVNKQDSVQVTILLWLSYVQIDEYTNSIDVFAFTILNWQDEFLKWNPSEYGNESGFSIHPSTIWTPTLALAKENVVTGSPPALYSPEMLCMLNSSGHLHCSWATVFRAACNSDDRHWPFNAKKCQLYLDQWDDEADKVNLALHKFEIIEALWSKGTWDLVKYEAALTSVTSQLGTVRRVVYTFSLRRRWTITTTLIFTSTLGAIFLTLTPFLMNHLHRGRLFVVICDMALHILTLQSLGFVIEHTITRVPLIVIFFRDSLIMALISLVLTVFWKFPVLPVVRYFPVKLSQELDKYLTVLRLKIQTCEQEMDQVNSSETIIRVVDVIFLIIFVMMYVVLCAQFIP